MKVLRIGPQWQPTPALLEELRASGPVGHPEPRDASFGALAALNVEVVAVTDVIPDGLGWLALPVAAEDSAGASGEPGAALHRLVEIVDRLLGPGGCPWDQEQTHESLKRHLLEEVYEVFDAIDSGSPEALKEELGDLLLQPVMHAQMEARDGRFDLAAVAEGLCDKLVRRHPHVFGPLEAADAEEVLRNWDRIKNAEKGAPAGSILDGVPKSASSLLRAYEISRRAAKAGFEWPEIEAVFAKLREEESELREALDSGATERIEAEVGDLLFTAVNIARWAKIEPEEALRKMLNRFSARFREMERMASRPLSELDAGEWDRLWEASKCIVA